MEERQTQLKMNLLPNLRKNILELKQAAEKNRQHFEREEETVISNSSSRKLANFKLSRDFPASRKLSLMSRSRGSSQTLEVEKEPVAIQEDLANNSLQMESAPPSSAADFSIHSQKLSLNEYQFELPAGKPTKLSMEPRSSLPMFQGASASSKMNSSTMSQLSNTYREPPSVIFPPHIANNNISSISTSSNPPHTSSRNSMGNNSKLSVFSPILSSSRMDSPGHSNPSFPSSPPVGAAASNLEPISESPTTTYYSKDPPKRNLATEILPTIGSESLDLYRSDGEDSFSKPCLEVTKFRLDPTLLGGDSPKFTVGFSKTVHGASAATAGSEMTKRLTETTISEQNIFKLSPTILDRLEKDEQPKEGKENADQKVSNRLDDLINTLALNTSDIGGDNSLLLPMEESHLDLDIDY